MSTIGSVFSHSMYLFVKGWISKMHLEKHICTSKVKKRCEGPPLGACEASCQKQPFLSGIVFLKGFIDSHADVLVQESLGMQVLSLLFRKVVLDTVKMWRNVEQIEDNFVFPQQKQQYRHHYPTFSLDCST